MGTHDRSRKKIHLWNKATVHFSLCFVMGFFTGFAPTSKSRRSSSEVAMSFSTSYSPEPTQVFHQPTTQNSNQSLLSETDAAASNLKAKKKESEEAALNGEKLLIVVTPMSRRQKYRNVVLWRLANTLRLVAQPLLWVVVEAKSDETEVSEILRKTGIMYRHMVFEESFGDADSEMDHQRNLALNHIEHHRLSGVVHFAGLSNVYDLTFFQQIRAIEEFGAWPVAKLSANKKVMIEGAVCDSSEVTGWNLKNVTGVDEPPIHISSFAFNSSILWDPQRWGRTFSTLDAAQNSVEYVKQVVQEGSKLKDISTQGCSKIMLWDLHIPMEH